MESVLAKNPLFSGLQPEEMDFAVSFFNGRRKLHKAGEFLQHAGAPMEKFGLLLSGAVQVCMADLDGSMLIMANVTPGDTFGESLCFLRAAESPVYIRAVQDSELLWMDTERMRQGARCLRERDMVNRFTGLLARRALSMNDRIQILSKPTLRQKINTLFAEQVRRTGSRVFTLPFDREDMAAYLGADRSALSRELSRMKKEGLIDYYKSSFRLLD